MKKKALQICSLLVLAFILAVVSAEAQTIMQYKAQIPFGNLEKGECLTALAFCFSKRCP